jgi:aquaporin Z
MNATARRLGAEMIGTFWLVFGGCGAAVISANFIDKGQQTGLGIGFLGVAFAFGLTVVTGAYALGHISGGHFNPAVTLGLWAGRRFESRDVPGYIVAQIVGAIIAAGVLYVIARGHPGFSTHGNFLAANGYGKTGSPGHYSLAACAIAEFVLTGVFLFVILGVTSKGAPAGFGPLGIGLCLTLIHLISIPITNTSVNPARSIGPALFVGGDAIKQLWLFIVAPIAGGVVGAVLHRFIGTDATDAGPLTTEAHDPEAPPAPA